MPIRFIDNDEDYLQWVKTHFNGYVVNSYRNPTPSYLILHCATCGSISSEKIRNYTTTSYIKTCSEDRAELEDWARNTVDGQLSECSICLR